MFAASCGLLNTDLGRSISTIATTCRPGIPTLTCVRHENDAQCPYQLYCHSSHPRLNVLSLYSALSARSGLSLKYILCFFYALLGIQARLAVMSSLLVSFLLAVCMAAMIRTVFRAFYLVYMHPLKDIPGPKLAAMTWWYSTYYEVYKDGGMVDHLKELHEGYGTYCTHYSLFPS